MKEIGRLTQIVFALGVVMTIGGFIGMANSEPAADSRTPKSLEQALVAQLTSGWELVQPPTLAGPYRWAGAPYHVSKGQGGPVSWKNPTSEASHRFEPNTELEQMAFPLEAMDGRLTYAVLTRK